MHGISLRVDRSAAGNTLCLDRCAKQSVIKLATDILTAVVNERDALDMIRLICKDILLGTKQLKTLLQVVLDGPARVRSRRYPVLFDHSVI